MGYLLGSLPFSCGVSTHEQTMLFMSMGNLESAACKNCELFNCESGANVVCGSAFGAPLLYNISLGHLSCTLSEI